MKVEFLNYKYDGVTRLLTAEEKEFVNGVAGYFPNYFRFSAGIYTDITGMEILQLKMLTSFGAMVPLNPQMIPDVGFDLMQYISRQLAANLAPSMIELTKAMSKVSNRDFDES